MSERKMISQQLREVRLAYEREREEKSKKYARLLQGIDGKIENIRKYDYASDYKKRYAQLTQGMEALYGRINAIEEKTHGLPFRTKDYLPSLSPSAFSKGAVEEAFSKIAGQVKLLVQELTKDKPVPDYEPLLKQYCELLVTVRYINKNADQLLLESGLPEADRKRALAPVLEERGKTEAERDYVLKTENLDTYAAMAALRDAIHSDAIRLKQDMLGSGTFYFDKNYRYLLGIWKEEIPAEEKKFAEDILGLDASELNGQSIYFEPETGRKNIIINAHGKDMEGPLYKALVRNIYLSVAGRLPGNCLQYGFIACDISSSAYFKEMKNTIGGTLGKTASTTEGKYLYGDVCENQGSVKNALSKFMNDALDIHTKIKRDGGIYPFNRIADYDRQPFHIIFIDGYPLGFTDDEDSGKLMNQLLSSEYSQKSGFLVVVGQNVDKPKTPEKSYSDKITAPTLGEQPDDCSVVIDMTDLEHIKVDGREAVLNITLPDFDEQKHWEKLNQYYVKKESLLTEQLLSELDVLEGGKIPSPFDSEHLQIPLGYRGKQIYQWDLNINKACHIFVVGGSGYGKTSFLHTFILSTAYKYSPKEVQFYLADWKGAEFSFYKPREKALNEGIDVRALPHVRYLQDKNSLGDYVTFLQMVQRVIVERNELFQSEGCEDIVKYNRKMDRLGKDRIPFLFVIVDEYQTMLGSVSEGEERTTNRIKETWKNLVQAILSVARSAGVALVLCAQTEETEINLANVENRVVLGAGENADKLIAATLYGGNRSGDYYDRIQENVAYLSVKHQGRALIGTAASKNPASVRAAYSGDHKQKAPITVRIAEKFDIEMPPCILGGNEDLFPVDNPSQPPYQHMNDPVLRPGARQDENDDFAEDIYDREAFPMYIGVSTTDAYPSALSFSVNNNASGYAVYTGMKVRMNRILNSVMLSFLYKTGMAAHTYDGPRIHYFGTSDVFEADIGRTIKRNPFLGKHLCNHNVKSMLADSVEQLVELEKLRKQRDKQEMPEGGFTPILVVIHDVEWLIAKDDLNDRLSELWEEQGRRTSAEGTEGDFPEQKIQETMDVLRQEYLEFAIPFTEEKLRADAMASLRGVVSTKRVAMSKCYTGAEVRGAVKELFQKGNRMGIFLVVASDNWQNLAKFREDVLGLRSGPSFERIIYGSYLEAVNRLVSDAEEADREPDSVCYVYPGGVKTRIYSYVGKNNPVWWKKMEGYLN